MKFLDKLGLIIFSMIGLVLAILVFIISFGWMEPTIFGILLGKALATQTGTYITIGVSAFLILLGTKCLFFSSTMTSKDKKKDGILLENEDGKLLITKSTIENIVEGVSKEYPSIQNIRTDVKMDKNNNVSIDSTIDVTEGAVIKDVTSKLQANIKKRIKIDTDLEINQVNINVVNVALKPKKEETNNE